MIDFQNIKLVAFDADDTLWDCQNHFDAVERAYARILAPYRSAGQPPPCEALFAVESRNMPLLGYGCKAFTLSLMENALSYSRHRLSAAEMGRILELGKTLLELPATPLEGVADTLRVLRALRRYRLVVFTKGELLDQENKLRRSGLWPYFDDVVVVSDKTPRSLSGALCQTGCGSVGDGHDREFLQERHCSGAGVGRQCCLHTICCGVATRDRRRV